MLVATPSQAATYSHSLIGGGGGGGGSSANKNTCLPPSAATTPKSSSTSNSTTVTTNNCSNSNNKGGSNSVASKLMKTISVRLNRGTEFLKDTVQKALINNTNTNSSKTSSASSSSSTTTTTSAITYRSSHINNNIFNTTALKNIKAGSTITAVASSSTTSIFGNTKSIHPALTLNAGLSATASAFARATIDKKNIASKTTIKLNSVPPTKIHHYPQERQETSSTDSINKEMCYFKPIISAPTMRWKCGSKSRGGAAIRIPIACLARNIKHLNCDDCSIIGAYTINEDEQLELEDVELGKFGGKHPFCPKPSSTLLTTVINSPTHQSAFVRLVAKMKTLVNIQQITQEQTDSRMIAEKMQEDMQQLRHKTRRGRPPKQQKAAATLKMSQLRKTPLDLPMTQMLRSRKQPFVRMEKLNTQLKAKGKSKNSKKTTTTKTSTAVKGKKGATATATAAAAATATTTTTIPLPVTTRKATKRRAAATAINIVALVQKGPAAKAARGNLTEGDKLDIAVENKPLQRKRKHNQASSAMQGNATQRNGKKAAEPNDSADMLPPVRKSARLSKDDQNDKLNANAKRSTARTRQARQTRETREQREPRMKSKYSLGSSFSPPMTRSRLKELMQQSEDGCNQLQLVV